MFESFFGFRRRPFVAAAQVETYFPCAASETARQTLARCIERGEGPAFVLGPTGCGKSVLCHLFASQFRSMMPVALLASGGLTTRRSLLQAVLYALRRPYRGLDEGELRLALADYLTLDAECAAGLLLIVDEAHLLPLRLLDELRLLTNLARDGRPVIRLLLSGSCALEEKLASPRLDSLNQRIAARCYLQSLGRNECRDYLRALVAAVGGDAARLFSDDVCHAVYTATDGVPRLINQLCDHALLLAFVGGEREVSRARIEEAWTDLQQLPTPWNAAASPARGENNIACAKTETASTIEFGALSDTWDEAPAAPSPNALPAVAPAASQDVVENAPVVDGLLPPGEAATQDSAPPTAQPQYGVGALADDFRPRVAATPEVELVFDEFDDPLSAPFDEEEVVADRYSAQHAARSAVGRTAETSHASAGDDRASEGEQHADSWAEDDGEHRAGTLPMPRRYPESDEGALPAMIVVAADDARDVVELPRRDRRARHAATTSEVAGSAGNDVSRDAAPCPPVRPREFRSLFTRLRRERAG